MTDNTKSRTTACADILWELCWQLTDILLDECVCVVFSRHLSKLVVGAVILLDIMFSEPLNSFSIVHPPERSLGGFKVLGRTNKTNAALKLLWNIKHQLHLLVKFMWSKAPEQLRNGPLSEIVFHLLCLKSGMTIEIQHYYYRYCLAIRKTQNWTAK